MKRFIPFIFILIVIQFKTVSQINKYGIPFITNYTPGEYNASEQNWDIVQDNRGVMYFGNNENGVIEYDGVSWNQIPVTNNSGVRALACDDNGIVYVGAVGEFGYLAPNEFGKLVYKSLIQQLDSANNQFNRIEKIIILNNKVYFINVQKIFCFEDKKLIRIFNRANSGFLGFKYNRQLYFGNWKEGLNTLSDTSIVRALGGEFFKQKNIFLFLPNAKENIALVGIVTDNVESFIYYYNVESGEVNPKISNKISKELLKEAWIYNGKMMPDSSYALATINSGVFLLDSNAKVKGFLNKKMGLQNETVTNLYCKNLYSNLWLALDNGISKVEINSPFRFFGEESGLKGYILDICEFNKTIYVATSLGVYYLDFEKSAPTFKTVKNIEFESYTFLKFNAGNEEKLLVGTPRGLYEIKQNVAINIEQQCYNLPPDYKSYCFKLAKYKADPSTILIGKKSGLSFLKFKSKKWFYIEQNDKYNYEIRSLNEDNKGNIWLGTMYNGIIKVTINETDTLYKKYGLDAGLPTLKNIQVYFINDKLLFATQKGLYRYNENADNFIKDNIFPKHYSDGSTGIFRISVDNEHNFWFSAVNESENSKWIERLVKSENGYQIDNKAFMRLNNMQAEVIYHARNDYTWMGLSDKLVSFNPKFNKLYDSNFGCLIRKVLYGEDSVVFYGTNFEKSTSNEYVATDHQYEGSKPVFKHQNNAVTFFYAAPFYEEEKAIIYSYKLSGYENQWSKWSGKTEKGYTNLNQGKYTFKVKAKNIYGQESKIASYEFTILPPWYLTIVAFIVYFVLAIIIVYVIVKLYTRRLEQEKIRLEGIVRERTAEVVAQKDEIEKQRDQIAEQKQGIEDSILYASRIQRALLPGDNLRGALNDHFVLFKPRDIVSGDFYWMANIENKTFVVAADCTGHGVPGAFMSMLGMSFLNEIVVKGGMTQANLILNKLRENVISSLKQTGKLDEAKDGMDLALYVWDRKENSLEFSGANNPLYYIRPLNDEELEMLKNEDESFVSKGAAHNGKYILDQVKADKMPIGIYVKANIPFTEHKLKVEPGYTLYTFSDGYVDQFSGETGRKFMTKKFKRLLLDIQDKSMQEQHDILNNAIEEWKAGAEQVDDILVFGVKI